MLKKTVSALLLILLVAPVAASALSFSDITDRISGLFSILSGEGQVAAVGSTQPSLTVRSDMPSAANFLAVMGEEGYAGAFIFSATGASYAVQELRIKIPSDAATSVESVKIIYVTQSQTQGSAVQAVTLPSYSQSYGVATFTGLNMYVPKDSMGTLSVFITPYGDKTRVRPGVVLSASLDTATGFKAVDSNGATITSVGSGDITSNVRLYPVNTYPIVTNIPIPRNAPVVAGLPLLKFKMSTHVRSSIEWNKVSFSIAATGVSVGDFTLYDVTNGARPVNITPVNVTGGGVIAMCPGASCAEARVEEVPAGGERVYELRAGTASGWGDIGDSLTVRYVSDEKMPESGLPLASVTGNVAWSDRSVSQHSALTRDWFNGFFMAGFAGASTFIKTGTSTVEKIKVTAPNGGEEWDIGSLNTITWSPYGYDPDINPPSEVSAWLETKSGNTFKTVGKIVPSGKASIHWEGQIDTGGVGEYPKATPDVYYIRIENIVTGETDRSDKPFKIVRSVDLRINNVDGPLSVDTSKPVVLAWKAVGVKNCQIFNAYSDLAREKQIGSVSALGKQSAYLHSSWGPTIQCENAKGQTVSDYVPIQVKQGPARITIEKPNGKEKVNPNAQLDIGFQYSGISSFSAALYKNDKWLHWIARDVVLSPDMNTHTLSWSEIGDTLRTLGEATTTGSVFKIYVTGQKVDGSGYVDDKSNATFSFVVVPAPKQPVISKFSASPEKVVQGKSATLSWAAANAEFCFLSDGSVREDGLLLEEQVKLVGSKKVTPINSATYTLRCLNEPATGSQTVPAVKGVGVAVDIPALKTPTITRFTATPSSVKGNQPTVLSWATKDATSCIIASPLGKDGIETNGKLSVQIQEDTKFTIYCGNQSSDGRTSPEVSKQVSVKFTAVPAPSCTITADKKIYRVGDTVKLTWKSQNATSALWIPDTSGKDNIAPPTAVPKPNGSASVKMTVSGSPSLTLYVKGNGGEATCQVVLTSTPVFEAPTPVPDVPPFIESNAGTKQVANVFSALQLGLQAILQVMR